MKTGFCRFGSWIIGRCRQREKIDWHEAGKFDCRLVGTIFIFVVPRPIFTSHWRVARKSILIPNWTYFHCPGTTLPLNSSHSHTLSLCDSPAQSSQADEGMGVRLCGRWESALPALTSPRKASGPAPSGTLN